MRAATLNTGALGSFSLNPTCTLFAAVDAFPSRPKARAMALWEKEKAFAADLAATVETIVKELAAADRASNAKRPASHWDTGRKGSLHMLRRGVTCSSYVRR